MTEPPAPTSGTHDPSVPSEIERLARRGDELFRRLVDSVHEYAIFALAPDGTIASWNAGAQRIKGYSSAEAVGRHFSMLYPAEAIARGWPAEELRRAKSDGRFEDEGIRVRKDGGTYWANVVLSPLLDTAGEFIGFSKVTRDLTERRESERRIAESERNQRLLIESVRDHAMFLLDSAGLVLTWNAGCDRVFELSAREVVGKHVGILYPTSDHARGAARSELASATAARIHQAQGRRRRGPDGTFPSEVTTTALANDRGELTGFVQVVRDLSHEDRVLALENEGKRINEFIAMLSHELRNPLAPIRNAVTLLQRVSIEPALRRPTDIIDRQVTHLSRLVDDLMDVSRITTGKIHLERALVDIATLVKGAIETTDPLAQSLRHAVNVELPDEALHVVGDPARLHQVLVNLLTNSLRYTPDGGAVNLALSGSHGLATLKVTDTGVGMTDELMRHVFDPLVQGSRTLDRTAGGLGIGLTLVRNIVQLHGGAVAVASAGLGQGTTVTVTLPLAVSIDAESNERAPPEASTARTVLLVDDNVDAAKVLAECLELDGHQVRVEHNGRSALAAVGDGFPDLVILDIGLPGMSGHDVARQMRQMPGGSSVRLIALSGYGQDSDKQNSAAAGFDGHFVKPVDADVLSLYASAVPLRP